MSYTTAHIEELDEVTHTRRRVAVNLGSEDPFTVALREFVDNAVDEINGGHGDTCTIVLHADSSISVSDNGRGLPVDTDAKTGKNGIVKTVGSQRSGGKFDTADSTSTGAGTNGIGASAAVAISRRTDVTVVRSGKQYTQQFGKGYPGSFTGTDFDPDAPFTRNDTMKLRGTSAGKGAPNGTTIRVLFDPVVSPDTELDVPEVLLRAHASARMTQGMKLIVIDEGYPAEIPQALLGEFTGPWGTDPLLDLTSSVLGTPSPQSELRASIRGNGSYNASMTEFPFSWSLTAGPITDGAPGVYSFCNTVRTPGAGSHHNAAIKGVTDALAERASRVRGLGLAKGENAPEAQDFAAVTAMAIDTRAPNASWDSQAKKSITSRSLMTAMSASVQRSMAVWMALPANAGIVTTWTKIALEAARIRRSAEGAKARARAASKTKGLGTNLSLPEKLIPCKETGRGSGAELFICEGGSAAATIKRARDATTQAVYGQRGRGLNIWSLGVEAARKNQEFSDIEAILGCGIGRGVDPEKCRYDFIVFAADADPDGKAINCHLGSMFFRFYRPLIEAGMVYVAMVPLFILHIKDRVIYAPDVADRDMLLSAIEALGITDPTMNVDRPRAIAAILDYVPTTEQEKMREFLEKIKTPTKIKVDRCKGLGEMDAVDFRATVLNPATRNLIRLTVEDAEKLTALGEVLYGNDPAPRRDWMAKGRSIPIEERVQ